MRINWTDFAQFDTMHRADNFGIEHGLLFWLSPYAVNLSELDPRISRMTQICNEESKNASRRDLIV